MALVRVKNLEFTPLQITLKSPDEKLKTMVLGRREPVIVDEDALTEDVYRKRQAHRLSIEVYREDEE